MLKNLRQGVDLEVAAGRVQGSERSYRCIGKTKSCLLCGGERISTERKHLRLFRKNSNLPGEYAVRGQVDKPAWSDDEPSKSK